MAGQHFQKVKHRLRGRQIEPSIPEQPLQKRWPDRSVSPVRSRLVLRQTDRSASPDVQAVASLARQLQLAQVSQAQPSQSVQIQALQSSFVHYCQPWSGRWQGADMIAHILHHRSCFRNLWLLSFLLSLRVVAGITYFRATGTACWAGPKRTTRSVYNYAFGPKTVDAKRTPPSRTRGLGNTRRRCCTRSVNLCKRPWAYFERLLSTSGAVCPWPVSRPTLSTPKAATAETSAECLWNEGAKLWVDFLRLRHQIVLRCHTSKGEQLSWLHVHLPEGV